jgi:predicted dehydrogenase
MGLKVAIVGCGKIADAHVEEARKIPGVEVVAVCDQEPIMAEQLAVRYAIPRWFTDSAEMLAVASPNVVHITTPPQSHLALTKQAVDAGCHVFMEKPVALVHADVEALVAAVVEAKKKLTVNYWPNFEVQALELRRLYDAGVLGSAVHIESYTGYDLAGEFGLALRRDPDHWVHRLPGKLFQNMMDHVVNKIVPFLDDDDPCIHAIAYRRESGTAESDANEILDELRVIIQGKRTSAYATFCANARPVGQTLRVYGTKATVHVDFNARTLVLERKQSFPSALGRLRPPFQVAGDYLRQGMRNVSRFRRHQFHFFDGMRTLLTEFYQCIENDTNPPIAYRDILRVSAIMERIFTQVYPEVGA